jgi:GT2 family glycosyltransferase
VAIVLVTHNSANFIEQCLSSLIPTGADLIVVDNGSTDETKQIVGRYPHVRLIETDANLGYGKAINRGAAQAGPQYKYLILSNTDVVYGHRTVSTLISFLELHPEVGITAPQQILPTGGWQRSYGDTPGIWAGIKEAVGINSMLRWHRRVRWPTKVDNRPKEVGYVYGAVLAMPGEAYWQARGFDEDFYFYGDESDLCIRLRNLGWKVMFCPSAEVIHYGGGDSTRVDQSDRFYRFLAKSHMMLARKHLSLWRARGCLWLEKVGFRRLALTFWLIEVLGPKSRRPWALEKRKMMNKLTELWNEQLKELEPGGRGTGNLGAC